MAAMRPGRVTIEPQFVLRELSIILSGEGNIGSAPGDVAVGGYTATGIIPYTGCRSWAWSPERWKPGMAIPENGCGAESRI